MASNVRLEAHLYPCCNQSCRRPEPVFPPEQSLTSAPDKVGEAVEAGASQLPMSGIPPKN